jgi:hypothetical protein
MGDNRGRFMQKKVRKNIVIIHWVSCFLLMFGMGNSLASPPSKEEKIVILGVVDNIVLEQVNNSRGMLAAITMRLFYLNPNKVVTWGLVSKPIDGNFTVTSKGKFVKLECVHDVSSTVIEGQIDIRKDKVTLKDSKVFQNESFVVTAAKILSRYQYENEQEKLAQQQKEAASDNHFGDHLLKKVMHK